MFKKYLIILFCIFLLIGCDKIKNVTNMSEQQETDARLLYRGLMYGNLEQIKRHTSPEFFEKIEKNPEFLHDIKKLIPRSDYLQRDVLSVRYDINFLKLLEKKLIVNYGYQYDSKRIIYIVEFDVKTKKIIDVTISEAISKS
jgi:hypothetical protein